MQIHVEPRERVILAVSLVGESLPRMCARLLKAFADFDTPCSTMTKNTMIVRDVDVLRDLASGPGVTVSFSITTVDPGLARRIEPDTPPPAKRWRVMQRLAAAGVCTGVLMAPILPGLNDDDASLEAVIRAADHGAAFLNTGVLRLQGSVKDVYGRFLRADSPELLPLYRRLYPGAYAPEAYQDRIYARVAEMKNRYNLGTNTRPSSDTTPRQRETQLTLFT